VHTPKLFFLLHNSLLHLLIPPPCLFSFTFVSFGHFEFFWSSFSNASGHLHPHAICIPSFMLRTLLKDSLLEHLRCLFLSFYHFILGVWTRLLHWKQTWKQKSTTTTLCWGTTHSPCITLQSMQACLSSLLARMKSIWLQCWLLLKVIRWESLFLKRVFATIKS
jgi:hypothetical protein